MTDDSIIFPFLSAATQAGRQTALVTVTDVSGGSTRNPGAHMAVSDDGSWRGSLSGGCIEAAVAAEARDAIAEDRPRSVRFGKGSKYADLRLPCGGSIDLLFSPLGSLAIAAQAAALLRARTPFILRLPLIDGLPHIEPGAAPWRTQLSDDIFSVAHVPPLSILAIGHGGGPEALYDQAVAFGVLMHIMTPDENIVRRLRSHGAPVTALRKPEDEIDLPADSWTAIAFMFHDHDWEGALLAQALQTPAFYLGAMGSRTTHQRRLEGLRARGLSEDALQRLRAPIGIIHSSRNPQLLALSALAEIARDYNETFCL